ncbi:MULTISPECIES: polyprenyl synthetase family protein [Nitrospirillum]|uniref:Octaprenyl diphosphate synthase n=1 Tax=Nitrospirillum amazonense TaxID=28077 RepID=A0A560HKL7_9PROT|nr:MULTISPECIES: polyprenyl synthetase family protein [Nitrospirillum]MDZ5649329.1 polyprenyl synthetase family protein [Nitrospirillum sp. BR 11828]MEE3623377.1 polyprenyl synthetase family protein [Nitrospirillum sp. BR 11752]TWB45720.1 octaprenyl-diphosphate synthase [Nitrospirillum amazonense]
MAVVTPLDPKRRKPGTDALEALVELVATDLAAVNDIIIRRMHSDVEMIPQLAGYIVASGGKRLRPVLTLAAARLCGYQGERHQPLAACVEFIHTATLLHDDVVDESDLRRGQPSANAVFGNKASVLVGDFLFSRAFQVMTEDGSLDVLRILSSASAVISEGEVLQLITANDTTTSEEAYLEVIRAKTAELFAAACRIGAVVAGRPAAEEEALRSYGLNLGIAFQVVDDVLDYSAVQARLGKTIGDDFREGKITLPVVLAFRRGDDEERAFWRRTLEEVDQREGDLEHALALMQRHNTLRDSVERARHYGAVARDALGLFPASPIKRALLDVIDFVVDRDF